MMETFILIDFVIVVLGLLFLAMLNSFVCIGFQQATLYETERICDEYGERAELDVVDAEIPFKVLGLPNCIRHHDIIKNKNILWWLRHGTQDWSPWITEPLYGCLTCMASIHSVYVYWTAVVIIDAPLGYAAPVYLIYILLLAGINTYVALSMERPGP